MDLQYLFQFKLCIFGKNINHPQLYIGFENLIVSINNSNSFIGFFDEYGKYKFSTALFLSNSKRMTQICLILDNLIYTYQQMSKSIKVFNIHGYHKFNITLKKNNDKIIHILKINHGLNDFFYVINIMNSNIYVFNRQGEYQFKFKKNNSIFEKKPQFREICFGLNNLIYVYDKMNHCIQIYNQFGEYQSHFDPKTLNLSGLFFSKLNNLLFFCDRYNHRIKIFDPYGHFLFQFGLKGSKEGEFKCPTQLFFLNNLLYIYDYYNDRVQVFQFLKHQNLYQILFNQLNKKISSSCLNFK